jgi:hypothetical protein
MKKDTAVEWLVKTINDKIDYIPIKYWDDIRDIVKEAKSIEKQQLTSAYTMGSYNSIAKENISSEEYFNKNFNKEE